MYDQQVHRSTPTFKKRYIRILKSIFIVSKFFSPSCFIPDSSSITKLNPCIRALVRI